MEHTIFHVDVNSAFLSWEAVYRLKHLGGRLDLRTVPAAVGGDAKKRHGIILAKSIPAKKYGIQTGESTFSALKKCPELLLVPPNYNLYQRSSDALMTILKSYTPDVEQYSIDEAYMDMTGGEGLFGPPEEVAERLKDRILAELGFTVNIGLGENKLLAKMASDFRKPNLVHTLWKREIPEKMWPLPVSELFFIGMASSKKLKNLGITTIGELAKTDIHIVKSHFGKYGEIIWGLANGIDESPVESEAPPNKGYGNSTTIAYDVSDTETAKLVLLSLAETLGARLRRDKVKIGVVAVGIRDYRFEYHSHQISLKTPTNITREIYEAACHAFDESWDQTPIRHLGIHTDHVSAEPSRQLNLFDRMDYEKLERMDLAIDEIRKRYGNDAVKRACFLPSKQKRTGAFPQTQGQGFLLVHDHMSGGISREKRTVDYSREKVL